MISLKRSVRQNHKRYVARIEVYLKMYDEVSDRLLSPLTLLCNRPVEHVKNS